MEVDRNATAQKKDGSEEVDEETTQVKEPAKFTPGSITFLDMPPKITPPFPYPQ